MPVSSIGRVGEYQAFSTTLEAIELDLTECETVVLIPEEGCGSCISDATSFIYDKIDREGLSVLFTGVEGKNFFALTEALTEALTHLLERVFAWSYFRLCRGRFRCLNCSDKA